MVNTKQLLGTKVKCVKSDFSMGIEKDKMYLVESLAWGIGVIGKIEIDLDEFKNQKFFGLS